MKISNETKVGVLAAISITILIVGYSFMKGENLFSSNKTYFAIYDEVDGLFRSNPVVINGYKVGHVSSVTFNQETLNLIVSVQIPGNIKIPKNTVLKITNNDLLGSKAIEIIMGTDSTLAQDGDTLTSAKDPGMAQAITSVMMPLSDKVNSVLAGLDTAISDGDLKTTMNELNEALIAVKNTTLKLNDVLGGKSEKLDNILTNIEVMTKDLRSGTPKFNSIMAQLDQTSAQLATLNLKGITDKLSIAISELQKTLEAINSEEGSLAKLTNDDELWVKFNSATNSLDSLAKDMQRYPRRYLGITEKQRKKGDKQKEVNENISLPTETK